MRSIQVDTSGSTSCAMCNTFPSFRHHKGNDGLLGRYSKRILGNYKKYLDCVHLCKACHCEIHFIYDTHYMKTWINQTPKGAEHFRLILIGVCDRWLAGKIPRAAVPLEFKDKFDRSFTTWQKERESEK